jgi:hypothetical protein
VESDAVFGTPEPDKSLDARKLMKHVEVERVESWILSLI